MAYGAIDLHSTQSQVRIVTDAGEIVDRRIPTTRDQCARLFPPDPPMRVLLEASTESEWVAQCLEAEGHEVIVAPILAGQEPTSKGRPRRYSHTQPERFRNKLTLHGTFQQRILDLQCDQRGPAAKLSDRLRAGEFFAAGLQRACRTSGRSSSSPGSS